MLFSIISSGLEKTASMSFGICWDWLGAFEFIPNWGEAILNDNHNEETIMSSRTVLSLKEERGLAGLHHGQLLYITTEWGAG